MNYQIEKDEELIIFAAVKEDEIENLLRKKNVQWSKRQSSFWRVFINYKNSQGKKVATYDKLTGRLYIDRVCESRKVRAI